MQNRPRIAVTLGDPGGIGPEVVAKSLLAPGMDHSATSQSADWVVYGRPESLLEAAGSGNAKALTLEFRECGIEPKSWKRESTSSGGEASFVWAKEAVRDALRPAGDPRRVDAVVTAPISKQAWSMAGHSEYPGHTELCAALCGVDTFAMMFHAAASESALTVRPGLNVILATVHVPLSQVPSLMTTQRIFQTILLGAQAMKRLGSQEPRIAVCGLNPHAGEGGLIGSEEAQFIAPAIAQARAAGIDAHGPFPADTIFAKCLQTPRVPAKYDLAVAMYHDQGLAPLKTLAWDRAVNWTVGLPIIRTSPDHGTAFDIAGKSVADPGSMQCAMALAVKLAAQI